MSKLTKNQKAAVAKIEAGKLYTLAEACELVKEVTFTKFDASVEVHINLGVDPRKANQMVRGVVTLPNGTGKTVRVLVLCTPDKETEAKEAGADYVGLDEYIDKIKGGWTDVDVIICKYELPKVKNYVSYSFIGVRIRIFSNMLNKLMEKNILSKDICIMYHQRLILRVKEILGKIYVEELPF